MKFSLVTNNIFDRKTKERFFKYVPDAKTDCWIWHGPINNCGYGRFGHSQILAHRMAYTMYYGEIPDDMLVLHKCDVKRCVSPYHLYLGTYSDNLRDTWERNSTMRDRIHYSQFSYADRGAMIILKNQGKTYKDIGLIFGVTGHNISDVINNRVPNLRGSK